MIAACDQWRAGHAPPTGPKNVKRRKKQKKEDKKKRKERTAPEVDGRELTAEEVDAVTDWHSHLNQEGGRGERSDDD